jgi:hypothetical protein
MRQNLRRVARRSSFLRGDAHAYTEGGTAPDGFHFRGKARATTQEIAQEAETLLRASDLCPNALLQNIQNAGFPVVEVKGWLAEVCTLVLFGRNPGFIQPCPQGLRLLAWLGFLGWISRKQQHQASHSGFFLVTPKAVNIGVLAHQLHHALAFRANLPGYQATQRKHYQAFWQQATKKARHQQVDALSLESLQGLREAIRRDREALEFLLKMTNEFIVPSQQRLTDGSATI